MYTKFYGIILIGLFCSFDLNAKEFFQMVANPPPPYILVDNQIMKNNGETECELTVFKTLDEKELRIVRADPPKGKFTPTYLSDHPELISQFGRIIDLTPVMAGRTPATIRSKYEWDEFHNDVIVTIRFKDGSEAVKKISLDSVFFKDHGRDCLK